jgi:two-component system sensor histidine kinase RegB
MTDTLISDLPDSDFRHPRRRVRLDTILRLRWLAALGQLAAIFIVVQGLEFDLPVVPCLAIVSAPRRRAADAQHRRACRPALFHRRA